MRVLHRHRWNLEPVEAVRLQERMRSKVVDRDALARVRTVAGVDVGVSEGVARAAVALLSFPALEPLELRAAERPVSFPYVPGLLSFREIPAILAALRRLRRTPDLLMADGQGRAHPRRFGLASHLGVILDRPAIGCAKSRLCGGHVEPDARAGKWAALTDRGEVIGAAVRTREGSKPLYVSVGHRVSLRTAIRIALECCRGRRIPEPTRLADLETRKARSV